MKLSTTISKTDILNISQNDMFTLARQVAATLPKATFINLSPQAAKRLLWIKPLKGLDSKKITDILNDDLDASARLIGATATILLEPEDDGEAL